MRSVFQSISYVEDSQKLLKDWSVNLRTHALCLHSPSHQGALDQKSGGSRLVAGLESAVAPRIRRCN